MKPQKLKPRLAGKTIKLRPGREKSIARRHPWVFSGAAESIPDRPVGSVVDITSNDGKFLAKAFFNPKSQILGRAFSWNQTEQFDQAFVKKQLIKAAELRRSLPHPNESNAWRVFNSESDGIPGLMIDQFANHFIIQSTTAGVDLHLDLIVDQIDQIFKPHSITERSIDAHRELEGLELRERLIRGALPEDGKVQFCENQIKLNISVGHGHKTGYYLDQKYNRRLIRQFSQDATVLDCFCYSGGFTLNALTAGAKHVTSVDSSEPALEYLRDNLRLNQFDAHRTTQVCADVFDYLRELRNEGRKFDLIILDPPKLVKSGSQLNRASRAYQDLNRIGFELLNSGGYLATYSCSGHMGLDLFQKIVFAASNQAGCDAHLQQVVLQSPDHPIHLNIPESLYLKGLLCRKI
jgi:23S rRNA (cytosine1962-C5)-methyltransferase